MLHRLIAACAVAALLFTGCASSQSAVSDDNDQPPTSSYDEIVTGAESDEGLFTAHTKDDQLYYEIPDSLLGREMLMVSRIAQTANNIGFGGEKANTQVLRWERNRDKVLLRRVSYDNVADPDLPIYGAVRNANFEPIIMAFDIEAHNADSSAVVIDTTPLFTTDVPALGLQQSRRQQYQVRRLDAARTFLERAASYPENIEVRNVLTYDAQEPPSNGSTNSISLKMNHSMVLLPEEPMQARLCDDRVGYFSVNQVDYGREEHRAVERCYITRWRLEPSDPEAYADGELVEPVEPIVFYIDPNTPERYREHLKQGVDDWQGAFEAAGFKNAIMAKDPPTEEEDPEFSPEDIRYSVIRYFPSEIPNAYGPHVHDPRSGEILKSHIGWYHNVANLLRNWYFIQTAASNPDARTVDFDDDVMGELIRFVSAHEVGHTLGLPHNWGSSHAVPVDSLRSPTYTAENGTAASIMDYARFNYIAQPEDGVEHFDPKVGPYDEWSIEWGYRLLPEHDSPDAERETLNAWIVERADDPRYFYGGSNPLGADPRSQREALGDDNMEAGELGIANLQRIVPNLMSWTARDGELYDQMGELYGEVVTQWNRYLGHVTTNLGGVFETHKSYDQDGLVYEVVPPEQQQRAMEFLNTHAFETPEWLIDEEVLRRIEGSGAIERVRTIQVGVVDDVLDPMRMARLIEAEAMHGADEVYTALDLLEGVRSGVWTELAQGEAIDAYRRALQRGYLDRMHHLLNEEPDMPSGPIVEFFNLTPVDVAQSDIRPYVRGELRTLEGEIQRALNRTPDRATELHLQDALDRISKTLDS
ncbi:MAG: zinc-dependent metalloprotease [Longimonas sp.]|uniref:zinc-dependent metalloprotease n=1 Tax=Longimonas sp. TaxID=2039626 RepID=UPI003349680B